MPHKKYLPYDNTEVPTSRSLAEIVGYLESAGFADFIHGKIEGQYVVMAKYKGMGFRWSANLVNILAAMRKGTKKPNPDELTTRAERAAWRILSFQVKSACDILRYDIASVTTVFAGNLIDHTGQTFGDRLTKAAVDGQLHDFKLLGMQ